MGLQQFSRVTYSARINKGEIVLHPSTTIIYDDDSGKFLYLRYDGESIPLSAVKTESGDFLQLSFGAGKWIILEKMSTNELLDLLWEQGANQNLVYRVPNDVDADNLGTWYYGNSLRILQDGEPVTLEAIKIAANEVLDGNAWARGDSYMSVNGPNGYIGLVYGTDNDDDDAVRLASHINAQNGTDFGQRDATGVDDIGVCGGTGSQGHNDFSVLSYVVLMRLSNEGTWFLFAALAKKEHAEIIKQYREEAGFEAQIIRIGMAAGAANEPANVGDLNFTVSVTLDDSLIQNKDALEEHIARLIGHLIEYGREKDLNVIFDMDHPIMGKRLAEANDPAAYMRIVLSALPKETLVDILQNSLSEVVRGYVADQSESMPLLAAARIMALMSGGE